MSNRSYVITLSEQTFINSWHISPQTFVNSVSNKHHSWTHTRNRVQQTYASFPWLRRELVWSASDKRAPCERSEPNIQSNKSANRCKDYENCTYAKFAQFSNNWQRFFPTRACDTSCQSLTHAYRKLIKVGHSSHRALPRSHSSKPLSQSRRPQLSSRHMSNYSYVVSATCRAQMFPLCYES